MRRLNVWMESSYIGAFDEDDDGVTFHYDDDAPKGPISLSLPRGGGWVRKAPARFLENLLPDNPEVREMMRRSVGAPDTNPISLLDGADATGGLTFSTGDDNPLQTGGDGVRANDDAIAYRISTMRNAPGAWWQSDSHTRFSLAGNQPKFSLARVGTHWTWSNAANPSTHILKPAPLGDEGDRMRSTRDADRIEAVSMKLAGLCGLEVPHSGLADFKGEPAYIVRRFDRFRRPDGTIGRLHTEDMMQALGLPPENKYGVKAKQVLRLLHGADPTDELSYGWIRQLALNVSISNADAHAKNYSLALRPDGVALTPMYDVLTTTYWPKVDRTLPMSIGGANGAAQITPHHWERLAKDNGLDPDRIVDIARRTAGLVLANAEQAYEGLPADMRDVLLSELDRANGRVEPIFPDGHDKAEPKPMPHNGMIHVVAHDRNGYPVTDYWRRKPSR